MVRLRRILRSDSACSRTRRTANSATASTATDLGLRFGGTVVAALSLWSFDGAFAQDTSFGQRLFQDKADCQFCHGINGDGRGDPRSPGAAADLHKTRLNRDQLIEVIGCGRPGTEMPHFDKYAYDDSNCYGLKGKDLGNDAARDPHSTSLTKREIEAVADSIIKT